MAHSKTLLLAIFLVLPGCGDDGSPSDVDAGAFDQCTSTADTDLLMTAAADAGVPDGVAIGGSCATDVCLDLLLGDDGPAAVQCMEDCWEASALGDLSDGCRGCYLDATNCAGLQCAVPCFGSSGSDCTTCIAQYCQPRLDDCVGF